MSEQHFNALPSGYQLQEYTVKSVLGHGGFGITYLAADNNLGKDVAIKEYLPTEFAVRRDDSRVQPRSTADNDDYEWGLDRFMKEAQTLGLFRHHNIVPVYRAFKENGTAYMVMEYQKGQSLAELFRKHRSDFNEEDLLGLIIPLLDGLAVVHKAGYLHRDLKPGNIFIREDGSPVLLDFGAARNAVGRKSKNLTSIVTPGYAPLEQYFADGNQGPWTDIYAMASILYQAVAGRIPPEAPARVKRDPITPAVEAGRGRFSETFLAGIDTALRVEEEQRPQTVEQWRALLLGQEVPAAPPPTMGHAAVRENASVRSSATMLAGHATLAGGSAAQSGGSASMRFPTIGREDAMAHTKRRGMGAGKIAALVVGGVVLLAASGVGAYIALNPDHGLFGTTTADKERRGTDATKVSADADAQKRAEEEARRKQAEEESRRQADQAKRQQEEAARKKAEEEAARKKAEEEAARKKAEDEAKRRAEEARRRNDTDAQRRAEEEQRRLEEERRRAEEQRRQQDEARRVEEERSRRQEEEARRRDEEAKRHAEEQKRREQEEARRRDEEARARGVSCDYSVVKTGYANETDCFYVRRALEYTLTSARDGAAPSTWTNQRTGTTGSIRIIATQQSGDGSMCRRFQQTVTANGRTQSATGTACYRNNTWQIVS
jgi:hypothetical protein